MGTNFQVMLRGAGGYELAHKAIEEMQRRQVWPTPLNFEMWAQVVAEPDGELGREIQRIFELGEPLTEQKSEEIATTFLPGRRLKDDLADTSDQLNRHLVGVSQVIEEAQQSSAAYGRTLAGATMEMAQGAQTPAVQQLIKTLTDATRRVQMQNNALAKRLNDSTSEVQRLQQNLDVVRRDAMTDALTMLANRKALDEGLIKAFARADAKRECLTLAVLDIDHFKRFNDTWGHQTGDQVIRYVATVIQRFGDAPRLAARYGGEEFAVVFPGESAAAAAGLLDAARVEIASRTLKRRSTNEDLGAVTVSAGVAQRRPGESIASLVGRADKALYHSKHSGRNLVTNAEGEFHAAA